MDPPRSSPVNCGTGSRTVLHPTPTPPSQACHASPTPWPSAPATRYATPCALQSGAARWRPAGSLPPECAPVPQPARLARGTVSPWRCSDLQGLCPSAAPRWDAPCPAPYADSEAEAEQYTADGGMYRHVSEIRPPGYPFDLHQIAKA